MHELIDPFARLIEDVCPPAVVRAIEDGDDWRQLWGAFADSGFLDALVDAEAGGAGLSLAEIAALIELLGRHAVPLPVGETMIARALLQRAGQEVPEGPIALVTTPSHTIGAQVADHLLVATEGPSMLVSTGILQSPFGRADLDGDPPVPDHAAPATLRPIAAVLRAVLIAGAGARVLEQTVAYANERQQFGKPIGRQQAVQQQLAVLAEYSVSARMAARYGCRAGLAPDVKTAAAAKYCASAAAVEIAAIAHAVHGAIGISEEYDLQLLTRRLHAWRLADGSESYWAEQLGLATIVTPAASYPPM